MWTEAQRGLVICLKSSTAAKRWPMLQFVFHSAVAVGRTCFLSCHMCLNWSSKTLITEEVGFSVEVGERIGKGDRKSWKCRWSPGCSLRLKLGWTWGTTNCNSDTTQHSCRLHRLQGTVPIWLSSLQTQAGGSQDNCTSDQPTTNVGVPTAPRFNNLLEWPTELRKALYLWLVLL